MNTADTAMEDPRGRHDRDDERAPPAAPEPVGPDRDHMSQLVGSEPVVEATRYTIDALARVTGTTARTIRSYQDRGLLPPPVIVGRTGQYDADHIARLRVISRLLEERFSLASIGALLHAWETGESLAHILGLVEEMTEDFAGSSPAAQVTPVGPQPPGSRDAGPGAPDLRRDDGPRRVTTAELVAVGVPVDVVLTEVASLRADCERLTRRFVTMVETHVPAPDEGALAAGWSTRSDLVAGLPGEVAALLTEMLAEVTGRPIEGSGWSAARTTQRSAPGVGWAGGGVDDRTNEIALGEIDLTGNAVIADLTANGQVVAPPAPSPARHTR